MTTTKPETPPDDEQEKMLFDEKLNKIFRDACQTAFLQVPELRSAVVVFDFYRNLNDMPGINKGLWLSADGGKTKSADSVTGSLGATLQAAAHILDEQMQLYQVISTQLIEVSQALLEKQNELEALKT
jgi:hypothetical protein